MLMPSGSSLANLTNLSAAGRIVGCHSRDTMSVAAVSLHECPLSSLSFHRRRVTACADSKVQNGRKLRLRSKRWRGQESGLQEQCRLCPASWDQTEFFQGQLQALGGSSSPRELVMNIISLRKFLTQKGGTGLQVMFLEKNLPSEFSLRYLYVLTVNRAGDMFFSKN